MVASAWGSDVDGGAEPTGDAHLGERDGEAALADVVADSHQPGADRRVQAAVARRCVGSGAGTDAGPVGAPRTQVEVAAGELGVGVADQESTLPARLEVGRDAAVGVGHVGDGGDHERGRHAWRCAVGCRGTRCSASPCPTTNGAP